jgi:hypothetical protein
MIRNTFGEKHPSVFGVIISARKTTKRNDHNNILVSAVLLNATSLLVKYKI